MKAICLKTFLDIETEKLREEGAVFETTAERLSAINSTKYGQLAQQVEEKPSETVSVPKKPRRRTRKTKE